MPEHDDPQTPEEGETIDASAWQMWLMVYRTCGWWTALRTAVKFAWMTLKGQT